MTGPSNKVAVVTGGSRGIGQGIALALANHGVRIGLTYQCNRQLAETVADSISSMGGDVFSTQLHLQDSESIHNAISEIQSRLGPPNILVNNAAMAQEKPFETISSDEWDLMMAVNLRGPFLCCREVLPDMCAAGWGRIVNISSIGGQWGGLNQVHYATSKSGLIGLTRSLARLYSGQGVTCNAVAPGLVSTDMSAPELASGSGKEKVTTIPVGRVATIAEVADVVSFLASDAAGYITGQTINVNGGMYFG